MNEFKLYMVMIGCTPKGRFTEQHDIFFGIAKSLTELVPEIKKFWPDGGELHIDAWREVTSDGQNTISVVPKSAQIRESQLFFINLGGYKENEFEEYHYKMVIGAATIGEATKIARRSAFYRHFGFKGATSHIDDKYGIDVDDIYKVEDILSESFTNLYSIIVEPAENTEPDEFHIGYLKLNKL